MQVFTMNIETDRKRDAGIDRHGREKQRDEGSEADVIYKFVRSDIKKTL